MNMAVKFVVFMAMIVFCVLFKLPGNDGARHPVILIPGDGASRLIAELNKTTSKYPYCTKHTSNYSTLWMAIPDLLPLKINCLVENLRLWYDPITHKTHNTPGVDIKIPDFGNTSSVEYLDNPEKALKVPYFHAIVEGLVSAGYTRGVSVRGAPYDFRKAPNELGDYYTVLKDLLEETYLQNNNTKVVVVAHSMGNPVFLYFLNRQPQAWKDKFIQSFVSLAGVWGGSVKAIRTVSSGYNFRVFFIKRLALRKLQRSMPSTAFLLPSDQFWNSSEILVSTPEKNYTVANYNDFFQDMNFTDGYYMRKDTENLVRDLVQPGVPVHCVHGSKVPTPATIIFKEGGFPEKYPEEIHGDGDGSVNMRSLLGCLKWTNQQKYPVIHKVYEGPPSGHLAILKNSNAIKYILDVATGEKQAWRNK